MSKTEEARRYKWSNTATNLLVSIWSHDMVQGRLKLSTRNQPIWESIARFMGRKGFNVTGLQCRTRIKNMLCNYNESVRKKDRNYIEPYFDIFQKIVHSKDQQKKGYKKEKSREMATVSDCEMDEVPSTESSLNAANVEQSTIANTHDVDAVAGNLHASTQETQAPTTLLNYTDIIADIENVIAKAIGDQTKVISQAIRAQTELVQKLMVSERERLEAIILAEKESRRELENKMDKVIRRLEYSAATKQYPKSLIES